MKKINKSKRVIMILPPTVFAIPAVEGGAVEQLITHLLDVNEIENRVKFILVSKYDERAAKIKYHNSEVLYLSQDGFVMGYEKRFKFMWYMYRLWLKIFHNHIVEKIHVKHHNRMNLYSFQCAILAKQSHVDFVVNELHDFGNDAPMDIFNSIVGRDRFYNHIHSVREENLASRHIISNSISISEYVRNHWVVDQSIQGRNEVLYNCIDVGQFRRELTSLERLERREALGISEEDFLLIFCGRLAPEKGVEQLIRSFDLLYSNSEKNIKLLLIGSAAFSKGNITDFSKEILERANRNPYIIPLGYIPNTELSQYYELADGQIVPSVCQEGAGIVAIEGMAVGLPLIITKSGGLPEYVGDGTAIQLPIDSQLPEHIMEAVKKLSFNSELCRELGDAGKRRVHKFSREAYYNGFLEIVERAIDE